MEQIAFFIHGRAYGWSGIVVALAALGAAVLFLGIYLEKTGNGAAGCLAAALSVSLGVVLSRLLHWYCYTETYESLRQALTDFHTGGFGLLGAFAGCLLGAGISRMGKRRGDLPQMLDAMAIAGSAGIAVGRLGGFFQSADRGQVLESFRTLPWAWPVTNAVSGATEYRLATFFLQALVAGALAVGLWLFSRRARQGDTALVFLLIYGASQIVLDSTRYDSLYFRWNGFVSIEQVVFALALVGIIGVFSRRMIRCRGFQGRFVALWCGIAVLLGGAGYMEYHVQRHGSQALMAYSVMSGCLAAVVGLTLYIRHLSQTPPHHPGRFQAKK